MTIEKSPAPASTANASGGASSAAKPKDKSAPSGFNAILDSVSTDDASAAASGADSSQAGKGGPSDTASGQVVDDATAAAMAAAAADPAALQAVQTQWAQWLQGAQAMPDSSMAGAIGGDAALTLARPDAIALGPDGKAVQGAAAEALVGGKTAHPGLKGLAEGAVPALAGQEIGGAQSATQALAEKGRAKSLMAAQMAQGGQTTQMLQDSGASNTSALAVDSKDAKLMFMIQQLQAAAAQPDKAASVASGPAFMHLDQPASERLRASERQTDNNNYAALGATTAAGASSYADTAAAPSNVAPGTEVQVAEQVKYWISHDVQNAELKLDGLGKDPVQVSISMSGNEANIVFRTDESQARGILENASAHLRDMLGREGLVLAGVSVGTSGGGAADGSGGGAPRQRGSVRQTTVAPAALPSVASGPRRPSGGNSGRALDLFV